MDVTELRAEIAAARRAECTDDSAEFALWRLVVLLADAVEMMLAASEITAARHAVKVAPGDRVLLTFEYPISMEQADRAQNLLADRFPGVTFTFAPQVADVAVVEGDRP